MCPPLGPHCFWDHRLHGPVVSDLGGEIQQLGSLLPARVGVKGIDRECFPTILSSERDAMYDPDKDEVVQDLMEVSRQVTIKRIASMKLSNHPCRHSDIESQEWEKHDDRVSAMKQYFFQKVTGHPF